MELVQVAVGPSEGCLNYLMKLREIKVFGQLQRAGDRRLDAHDPGVHSDDVGVGIVGPGHDRTMPATTKGRKHEAVVGGRENPCERTANFDEPLWNLNVAFGGG
jgi:hypothetical protein